MAERVSEAELQLLAALWDRAPQTATELADSAGQANGWTLATVKTLLARLVQKGAVAAQADGRRFLYSPLLARSAVVAQESQRLVDRLLGGRVSPLVAHLAEREALSAEDIAEIEDILRRLKP
jgi:BlaI family transcriptional regulator, penicillinase repressor